MSSRSSSSVSSSRSRRSATCSRSPPLADSISIPARVTRRAKRSGRIAASPRPLERLRRGCSRAGRSTTFGRLEPVLVALAQQVEALSASSRSSGGLEHRRVLAPAQDPGDQLARARRSRSRRPCPCRGRRRPSSRCAARRRRRSRARSARRSARGRRSSPCPWISPSCQSARLRVVAAVEVLGRREVVLGLGGVADLALDPREAEDADRVALVRVADQVELAAAEDEVEGVDLALLGRRRAPSCSR